jgi:hypothetical protein
METQGERSWRLFHLQTRRRPASRTEWQLQRFRGLLPDAGGLTHANHNP